MGAGVGPTTVDTIIHCMWHVHHPHHIKRLILYTVDRNTCLSTTVRQRHGDFDCLGQKYCRHSPILRNFSLGRNCPRLADIVLWPCTCAQPHTRSRNKLRYRVAQNTPITSNISSISGHGPRLDFSKPKRFQCRILCGDVPPARVSFGVFTPKCFPPFRPHTLRR